MPKDNKILDAMRTAAAWAAMIAAFFGFLCLFCALVNRALDIEDKAQRELIKQHKAYLRENSVKD